MVFARDLHHVLDVPHDVGSSGLPAFRQIRHEVDTADAAFLCDRAQLGVGAIARMIGERLASRMSERDRLLRHADRIGCRLAAAMTQVDENAELVHALDRRHAGAAQACIRRLEAPVAEKIAAVVRRLHDAQSERMQIVEAREIGFERDAILQAIDQASAPCLLRLADVTGCAYAPEHVGMAIDLALPVRDAAHRLHECRVRRCRANGTDGDVCAGDAGFMSVLEFLLRQAGFRVVARSRPDRPAHR